MSTLQKKISDEFLAKLEQAPEFDEAKLKRLRDLMASGKRPQPNDFVEVFSTPVGGALK